MTSYKGWGLSHPTTTHMTLDKPRHHLLIHRYSGRVTCASRKPSGTLDVLWSERIPVTDDIEMIENAVKAFESHEEA